MNKKEELRTFLVSQHVERDKVYVDLSSDVANRYAYVQAVIVDLQNLKITNQILLQIEKDNNILSALPFDNQQKMFIRQGLWRSIVIGYAKLFVQGRMKLNIKDHLKQAEEGLIELHKRLIQMRHKYIAHGGNNPYEDTYARFYIEKDKKSGEYIGRLGHIGIKQFSASQSDLEDINKLIGILLINLNSKVDKLWRLVMDEIDKEPIDNWIIRCENKQLL